MHINLVLNVLKWFYDFLPIGRQSPAKNDPLLAEHAGLLN